MSAGDEGELQGAAPAGADDRTVAGRWTGARRALGGAAALGTLSGLGDWIWWRYLEDGALVPALGHGVLFFAALAIALGWGLGSEKAVRRLASTLPGVGLVLAGVFYPVAIAVGYGPALVLTWSFMWLALALAVRWAGRVDESLRRGVVRGLLAALLSGLAFWSVSDMWTKPVPGAPPVIEHSLRWAFALAPGLLCLLVRRPGTERSG